MTTSPASPSTDTNLAVIIGENVKLDHFVVETPLKLEGERSHLVTLDPRLVGARGHDVLPIPRHAHTPTHVRHCEVLDELDPATELWRGRKG